MTMQGLEVYDLTEKHLAILRVLIRQWDAENSIRYPIVNGHEAAMRLYLAVGDFIEGVKEENSTRIQRLNAVAIASLTMRIIHDLLDPT